MTSTNRRLFLSASAMTAGERSSRTHAKSDDVRIIAAVARLLSTIGFVGLVGLQNMGGREESFYAPLTR